MRFWGACIVVVSTSTFSAACGGQTRGETNAPPASTAGDDPDSPNSPNPPSSPTPPGTEGPNAPEPTSMCGDQAGAGLLGVTYDVTRSRFAFGSTPTMSSMNGLTRWIGKDGVLTVLPLGQVGARMNAGTPSTGDWSADPAALSDHVRAYLVSLGIAECQILRVQVLGGSLGMTISLARALDGIPVAESKASARMNIDDRSTYEDLHWPNLPAATIVAAKAFRDQLADPTALAAYRSKLPAGAQGLGQVVVHHTTKITEPTMRFDVTWDVEMGTTPVSFDVNGVQLGYVW